MDYDFEETIMEWKKRCACYEWCEDCRIREECDSIRGSTIGMWSRESIRALADKLYEKTVDEEILEERNKE